MLIALIPLLICLAGFVLWLVASKPPRPWARIGEILFFVGLLVLVATMAHDTWSIGPAPDHSSLSH